MRKASGTARNRRSFCAHALAGNEHSERNRLSASAKESIQPLTPERLIQSTKENHGTVSAVLLFHFKFAMRFRLRHRAHRSHRRRFLPESAMHRQITIQVRQGLKPSQARYPPDAAQSNIACRNCAAFLAASSLLGRGRHSTESTPS